MVARRYIVSIEILRRYQAAKGWKKVKLTPSYHEQSTTNHP
jgi:hypothetical protein